MAPITGSAICSACANSALPVAAIRRASSQRTPVTTGGTVVKLSTSAAMTSRCPLIATNTSISVMVRKVPTIGDCSEFTGSMNAANESPICSPITSPASPTAAKATWTARPSAAPTRICWTIRSAPSAVNGETGAPWGSAGATSTASSTARPIRARRGTLRCANSGTAVSSARMRKNGYTNAASHWSSSAAEMLTMAAAPAGGARRQPIICGMLP